MPLDVIDFAGQSNRIRRSQVLCLQEQYDQIRELLAMKDRENVDKDREIAYLKSEIGNMKSKLDCLNKTTDGKKKKKKPG